MMMRSPHKLLAKLKARYPKISNDELVEDLEAAMNELMDDEPDMPVAEEEDENDEFMIDGDELPEEYEDMLNDEEDEDEEN